MRTVLLLLAGSFCIVTGLALRRGLRPPEVVASDERWGGGWSGEADRVRFSTDRLYGESPDLSARRTLNDRQREKFIAALLALLVAAILAPQMTVLLLIVLCTVAYVVSMATRIWLFVMSLGDPVMVRLTDEEARAAPGEILKDYTVMVPVFHEPEVMSSLIANLRRLEYPAERLQILLLVEADDASTVSAARAAIGPVHDVRILFVPPGGPRTKPKALNYGLTHATGTYLTIFDAEDRPDPLQLRKAALAFSRRPAHVACFQARLGFFNGGQNLITRWFQLEYSVWFRQMLPGLSRFGAPIPLGGTSNHFRVDVLLETGAWDPDNVTEDADLGARLSQAGYSCEVLDSVTLEEANSDFVNWAKQRSRWYKGYLQTFLVHARNVRTTCRAWGRLQFLLWSFFVGGTPIMALVNPIFWGLAVIWFTVEPGWLQAMFPAPIYYLGLLCWLAGNFLFTFIFMMESVEVDDSLFVAGLLSPIYWVMMSVAAYKAIFQVVLAPHYWEKTRHGLTTATSGAAPARSLP